MTPPFEEIDNPMILPAGAWPTDPENDISDVGETLADDCEREFTIEREDDE